MEIVEKEVIKIISECLNKKAEIITMESSLKEDLNADSLDVVELLMAFEEKFNISVEDDEAVKFKTVGDIVAFIKSK